ncbi:MAG TPA: PQQ-binding-like beta-propeller repeat protein [Polyangia bacterium]|nr:PQQ-binding-like beta-propeller repeat protein [Polyangia bacterium]
MTRSLLLSLLLLAGCGGGAGGMVNVSKDSFVAPVDVLQVKWRRHLVEEPLLEYKPQEFASAVSDGARVYVGSSQKVLWALSARDGAILWDKELGGAVSGRPLVVEETGMVYVGCDDGKLYAFDAATGAERWVYLAHGPIASQPVFAGDSLYVTSGENRVYAIEARTGKWRWQYDRESPDSFTIRGYPSPLVVANRVYVGFSDGYLACLSATTGDVAWARSLAGDATRFMDVDSTPLYYRDTLYVSAYATGVYALDPKDGSTKWRFDVEGATTVRARGSRLYFTATKSGLHALDLQGHLLWRQALAAGGELSPPTVLGSYLLVSSAHGGTYVADARNGRLYQYFAPGHGVTSEATTDGRQVYVLSNGGYFYALALNKP